MIRSKSSNKTSKEPPTIRDPIVVLKARDKTQNVVVIKWVPMTKDLIQVWNDDVQPVIDANYRAADDSSKKCEVRADVKWNWSQVLLYMGLHNFYFKESNRAVAVAAVMQTDTRIFPIGMLTCVPLLECNIAGKKQERGFVWYLSDAPKEVYESFDIPPVSGMATALLDSAIQLSCSIGGDGTLLLHADPSGGEELCAFYRSRGMEQLKPKGGPVTTLRRLHKSEEYFVFSSSEAEDFCKRFDAQRASKVPAEVLESTP